MNTQDRLIESTRELLWERGYVASSPKAIQLRAGVGQGSMYHHFEGKSDLAAAAVRRNAEQMRADLAPIFDSEGPAFPRLAAYLLRERDVLRGCRIGGLTQDPEIIGDPQLRQPLEETFSWLRRRIAEVIAEGQASGELDPAVDPTQVASLICAVNQGGYVLARAEHSPIPFEDAVQGALSLLENLVSARGGA
jgi:AcrR family transcriptional regulator